MRLFDISMRQISQWRTLECVVHENMPFVWLQFRIIRMRQASAITEVFVSLFIPALFDVLCREASYA